MSIHVFLLVDFLLIMIVILLLGIYSYLDTVNDLLYLAVFVLKLGKILIFPKNTGITR